MSYILDNYKDTHYTDDNALRWNSNGRCLMSDAMEELYTAFLQSGAKMIGKVPTSGYTYDESKSVIDGKFCGLPIDEDNESELTDQRLQAWVQQITAEA